MILDPSLNRGGQRVERYTATEPVMCGVEGSGSFAHDTEHPAGTVMVRSTRPRPDGGAKPEMCAELYDEIYGNVDQVR